MSEMQQIQENPVLCKCGHSEWDHTHYSSCVYVYSCTVKRCRCKKYEPEKPAAPVPEPDWEGIAASAAENRAAPIAPQFPINARGGNREAQVAEGGRSQDLYGSPRSASEEGGMWDGKAAAGFTVKARIVSIEKPGYEGDICECGHSCTNTLCSQNVNERCMSTCYEKCTDKAKGGED